MTLLGKTPFPNRFEPIIISPRKLDDETPMLSPRHSVPRSPGSSHLLIIDRLGTFLSSVLNHIDTCIKGYVLLSSGSQAPTRSMSMSLLSTQCMQFYISIYAIRHLVLAVRSISSIFGRRRVRQMLTCRSLTYFYAQQTLLPPHGAAPVPLPLIVRVCQAFTLDCLCHGGMADNTAVCGGRESRTQLPRSFVERRASENARLIDPSEWRATSEDFAIEWRCGPFPPRGQGRREKGYTGK